MALSHPLPAARAAVSLLAATVMAVALATPAFAQASTTTTASATSTTSTTGPTATTSTTTVGPTTTAPHGPPTTLVDPKKLAGLLRSLNADLARMSALQSFVQAKKVAATLAAGGAAATTAAGITAGDAAATAAVVAADADLVRAAAAQLAAANAKQAAQDAVISARHRLHELAVAYYVHADVGSGSTPIVSDGTTSPDGSTMLGLLLPQERDQLSRAGRALTQAVKDQVSSKAHADQLVAVRVAAVLAEARRLAAEATTTTTTTVPPATATTKPGAAGPAPTTRAASPYAGAGLSILGPPVINAAELAAWYASTGHKAAITVPLATLTGLYQASGVTYGVRDDIAFTQSIIETGYFGFPSGGQEHTKDNNFAGIGACDSCSRGNGFPDAKSGVDAQLQLLHNYASSQPLPGPLALTAGPTGCCPTWMSLTGVWATNPNYGFAILTLYKHILEWVLPRRSATAGL
jgi:Mannosyl-glycoprotein endo-beta-N-acetylglucosaminidase